MTSDIASCIADLGSGDAARRRSAAERLARWGELPRGTAAALARACGDADAEVRDLAAGALEDLGAPSAEDLPELLPLVRDENANIAYWAVTLIGRLGPEAAPAVTPLVAALSVAPINVRERSAWALGQMGPAARAAREALRRESSSNAPRLARLAAEALQRIE
jgi:HEAT repeat protein